MHIRPLDLGLDFFICIFPLNAKDQKGFIAF